MRRTHHCNELTLADAGRAVTLVGWIDSLRDHGGILFVDLRDREGRTQVVLHPNNSTYGSRIRELKPESVIEAAGTVEPRSEDTINRSLKTGEVEIHAEQLIIHNISETPPFQLDEEKADRVSDDLRLTYRYLDLRRPSNVRIMRLRHRTAKSVRDYLDERDFIDVEMPTLFKSTPEGAREFLVPSRLNPGSFYALTQSPQQLKQMLMVAGVDRYYSLARCYRDEDTRADRQPEFTQIDLEMSFIDREDMYALIEGMMSRIWESVLGLRLETPFPRLSYRDAMNRFGIDKPDTRFDFEIVDFSDTFADSGFKVFARMVERGGVIKAVNMKGLSDVTQGELKSLEEGAKSLGAQGLAFIKVQQGEWRSPITKFFSEAEKSTLSERLEIEDGDLVFFAADQWEKACTILGRVRLDAAAILAKRKRLQIPSDRYDFLWVTEFPLVLFDPEEQRFVCAHHPFTSPVEEDIELLDSNPRSVRGQHYDLVLNGVELGGGSIRIHKPELQEKVFRKVLEIPEDVVQNRFGYMLKAFAYGAPPHGGIAFGFDRLVAILAGKTSIRDVVAFPKTQKGQCLMSQSPGEVDPRQLRELHIRST